MRESIKVNYAKQGETKMINVLLIHNLDNAVCFKKFRNSIAVSAIAKCEI